MAGVPKTYSKLAGGLVIAGMGLFSVEQFGLGKLSDPAHPVHLDGTLLSAMVLLPIGLIVAGAIVFMVGRFRAR